MLSIISIIGQNRAIGKNNKLIWNIPDDLKHFKKITSGHTVIMGRKTFESIGRPLPNRTNIIITKDKNYKVAGCHICHSLECAIQIGKDAKSCVSTTSAPPEIFIIGGGEIYRQTLPYANKLYLTIVEDSPKDADTFFPDYSEFTNILSEEKNEYNGLKYKFVELMR